MHKIVPIWGLCLLVVTCYSCAQKGVVVTADPERLSELDGCFALLGASVNSGGPILKRLCSQDIDKIVSFSHLEKGKSAKLKMLLCGDEANPEKFKNFFKSLTTKEKARIIRSFELFGYNINGYGC